MSIRDEERSALALMKAVAGGDPEAMDFLLTSWGRAELATYATALAVWHVQAIEKAGRDPVVEIDSMLAKLLADEASDDDEP